VSIYVGLKISKENQAPDDSQAASCAWCEGNPSNRGSCPGSWYMFANEEVCNTSATNIYCCEQNPPGGGGGGGDTSCTITYGGGVTGGITISNGCGDQKFTFETYWKTAPNGTSDGSCVGTSTNKGTVKLGKGTHCPRNMGPGGCGYCVQVDKTTGDFRGGVAQFTGNCAAAVCGDGTKNGSEQCDPQATPTGCSSTQSCTTNCQCVNKAVCGDGTKNGAEQCDPQASPTGCASGQTCNNSCQCVTTPICGNGTMEAGEECENGHACTTGTCNMTDCSCSVTPQDTCGDSVCGSSEATAKSCEVIGGVATNCSTNQPIGDGTSTLCRSNCTWCGDGTVQTGEACDPAVTGGPPCTSTCTLASDLQCTDMSRLGTDEVGPSEVELFNVTVTGTSNDDPYDEEQVVLRVSSTSDDTPVGRDQTDPASALVSPYALASSENATTMTATYYFAWEALNVNNSNLTNGSFDVEVSFDGGSTWSSISACRDEITYDSGEQVEPAFTLVKTGSAQCTNTTGAEVTYTVTLTNLGPGQGVVTYVEDILDSDIQDSWVSDITSSRGITGTVSNGRIRWAGTESQRTYSENESATFTYTISIPPAYLGNFNDGINNIVTAVSGDNQVRFNYYMETGCTGNLPSTGILDTTPWIFGMMAVVTGLIALRLKVGQEALMPVIDTTKAKTTSVFTSAVSKLGFGEVVRSKRKKKIEKNF